MKITVGVEPVVNYQKTSLSVEKEVDDADMLKEIKELTKLLSGMAIKNSEEMSDIIKLTQAMKKK